MDGISITARHSVTSPTILTLRASQSARLEADWGGLEAQRLTATCKHHHH
jgi:hypothetical protein